LNAIVTGRDAPGIAMQTNLPITTDLVSRFTTGPVEPRSSPASNFAPDPDAESIM